MAYDQILEAIKQHLLAHNHSKTPLYLCISQSIQKVISEYDIKEKEPLPSERDLANFLNVSRITIRKAIQNLEHKAIVNRVHGRGTFVKKQIRQTLQNLSGFTEEFGGSTTDLEQKWLMRKTAQATDEEAQALNIAYQSPVTHLKRIRYVNHMPLALEHAVLPQTILDDPHKISLSLYQYLGEAGYTPVRALQKITAKNGQASEAELLQVPPHSALLYIERRSFDANNLVVEFVRSLYRSDLYELMAELHIPTSS